MRIEEKIRPVVIETEAILAIGMLLSVPPIQLGLILATLSGVISIRVGKIVFPEVNRLAVKTRGELMGASIRAWTRVPDRPPSTDDQIHHDRKVDADGFAVHERRTVAPLTYSIDGRVVEQRVRGAEDRDRFDAAVFRDHRAERDASTQADSTRRLRIRRLDLHHQ